MKRNSPRNWSLPVLALVCLLALAAFPARAEGGSCGADVSWTMDDAGVLTIAGTGPMTDFAASGDNAAPWGKTPTAVMIGEGVTSVGQHAFYGCTRLASAQLPSTLERIGGQAFMSCSALRDLDIPEGVVSIGAGAFVSSGLRSLTIPDSVVSIGEQPFAAMASLTFAHLGAGVTTLPSFADCTRL